MSVVRRSWPRGLSMRYSINLTPDTHRKAAGRDVNGRFPPGVSGNPAKRFQPGVSGNPTGRPKTFSIHQLVAEAIDDKDTRTEAVKRLQDNLKRAKTVVNTLEFAARVNHEIGLGSEERVGGVTIIFQTNLKPGSLKRPAKVARGKQQAGT